MNFDSKNLKLQWRSYFIHLFTHWFNYLLFTVAQSRLNSAKKEADLWLMVIRWLFRRTQTLLRLKSSMNGQLPVINWLWIYMKSTCGLCRHRWNGALFSTSAWPERPKIE
jgi:hypothetical protein